MRGERASVAPPRPAQRSDANLGATSTGDAPPEGATRAPDSLVPVRFTDLLDERVAEAKQTKSGSPRAKIRVLGAFVAGALVMLVVEALVTRAGRAQAPPTTVASRPAVAASPPPLVVAVQSPSPAVAIEPRSSAEPQPNTTPEPEQSATVPEPAQSAAPSEQPAEAAPSASAVTAEHGEEPVVHRHKRARHSADMPAYEPPTAEFPDYARDRK